MILVTKRNRVFDHRLKDGFKVQRLSSCPNPTKHPDPPFFQSRSASSQYMTGLGKNYPPFCTCELKTRKMCLLERVVYILHPSFYNRDWLGGAEKPGEDEPKDRCRSMSNP